MDDNPRYIANWWSWKFKSRTGTRGATVRDLVSKLWGRRFGSHQAGSVGAHCWRVPNRTKQLSSAPVSFLLSTLLIGDEILIANSKKIPHYLQNTYKKNRSDYVCMTNFISDIWKTSNYGIIIHSMNKFCKLHICVRSCVKVKGFHW